jgi:predicted RNA-binding protein with PUA domain
MNRVVARIQNREEVSRASLFENYGVYSLPDTPEQKAKTLQANALLLKFKRLTRFSRVGRAQFKTELNQLRRALYPFRDSQNRDGDIAIVEERLRVVTAFLAKISHELKSVRQRSVKAQQERRTQFFVFRLRAFLSRTQSLGLIFECLSEIEPNAPAL